MKDRQRPSSLIVGRMQTNSNITLSPKNDSPRRKKQAFLTSISGLPGQTTMIKVQELYQQLNGVIDSMDIKIQDVINRHEAEFLLAYRSHMKKIKIELQDIRNKTASVESNSTSFERITILEKQLILFRQEALKLYDSLEQKNRECQQYKLRLDEANSQNRFLEAQVKKLMKRTKYLEAEFSVISQKTYQPHAQPLQYEQNKSVPSIAIKHAANIVVIQPPSRRLMSRKIRTADTNRASRTSAGRPIDRLKQIVQDDNILNNIKEVIGEADEIREKKFETVVSKYEKMLRLSNFQTVRNSELEAFFFKCVETVRKEILKRTNNQNNYNSEYIDYESFMRIDCQRVLELFVTNEAVRNIIHNQMFGKRTTSAVTVYNSNKITRSRLRIQSHNKSLRYPHHSMAVTHGKFNE